MEKQSQIGLIICATHFPFLPILVQVCAYVCLGLFVFFNVRGRGNKEKSKHLGNMASGVCSKLTEVQNPIDLLDLFTEHWGNSGF